MKYFTGLKGRTLKSCFRIGDEQIVFKLYSGEVYLLHHFPDGPADVRISYIVGDLMNLVGSPILLAEESSEDKDTFYTLATSKGCVGIQWCGRSNGPYSTAVSFN